MKLESGAKDPDAVVSRLAAGQTCFTFGIRNARSPEIARMAVTCGYDVLWIDLEHSTMSLDEASLIALTARDGGAAAWIRIPEGGLGAAGRLLDGGASGIIVPHVTTQEDARAAVAACRYPPRGARSQNALLPQLGFSRLSHDERVQRADAATVVQVLIESHAGIENIEEIAGVDGVDLIGIGLNDLSASLGKPGRVRDRDVTELCRAACIGAEAHGKPVVIGGVADPEHFLELRSVGAAPLVFAGIDTEALVDILSTRMQRWSAAPGAFGG
jgi:2-keto-3-deoxy-L-rhamnonate aldolase RhmA